MQDFYIKEENNRPVDMMMIHFQLGNHYRCFEQEKAYLTNESYDTYTLFMSKFDDCVRKKLSMQPEMV